MDHSFFYRLQKKPNLLVALIAAITAIILFLNGYGLMIGITNVLPHLFYIPIILTAYFFPRRGIQFSVAVSAIYCGMIFSFDPTLPGVLLSAGGRIIMFILIAAVVSFLTIRLRESETSFRGVAERSSDIILLTDIEARATYVSPSVKRILGYNPAEIIGKLPADFIHPDDLSRLLESIPHLERGVVIEQIMVRFRRKNGEYAVMEFSGTPFMKEGVVAGIQVIGRDVTERTRVEEAHRETSQRLADIIGFLPDPTMVIDKAGNVIAWNHAMELMSGIPAAQMLGKGRDAYMAWISGQTCPLLIDYVLRQDAEGIKTAYPHAHFEGNIVKTETDITRVDGTLLSLWISATPLVDPDGEVTGAIESIRDVTHQKKIARALRESNEYLDTVINTLADPLFIKDREHRFVKLNDSFCQFSGHKREELLGKSDYDFFKKEEAEIFWEKDEEVFRSHRENENEERITDSLGNTHTISTKKTCYVNTAGEEFIVGIIRDITERKKMEAAIRSTNKKLNLLSSITRHDIRNQLMALNTYIQLSEDAINEPDELRKFFEKEAKIAGAIAHQISFTRDYEDLGVNTPIWQNIHMIITRIIPLLPMRNIAVDAGDQDLEIFADPLLEKVFYNLIDNSLKYGGEQLTAIRVTNREVNGMLVITVDDDGTGISAEDKPQLFTRGFGKNTGLGLYLSREILAITDIAITETGTPGKGARFEITVPEGAYRFADP